MKGGKRKNAGRPKKVNGRLEKAEKAMMAGLGVLKFSLDALDEKKRKREKIKIRNQT